jgi:hypothetical protein
MSQENREVRLDTHEGTAAAVTPFLRPGEVVEVRSAAEILATLDADGTIDGMPFMPEMLRYAGQRLSVSRRVEKLCDTIAWTGSRRMRDTVYLEDLRCDGSGHGGCQAGCMLYWKEAWLKRVDGEPASVDEDAERRLEQIAVAGARPTPPYEADGRELWRCQATEASRASEPLKTSDLRQYWREMKSGNYRLGRFIAIASRGFFWEIASRMGLLKQLPLRGDGNGRAPEPLGLKAGDLVQVRTPAEIAPTLDADGLSSRLSFDREMRPYCGGTYRVRDRVERLVDDRTGRMLKISADCLILEGVVCSGERSPGTWFCPRQIYPYWREAWLRRVDEPAAAEPDGRPSEATTAAR